ncbi:MAG: prepilin-type N-terminal cleavage/methylation domain-containing protein [Nitrospirae bacterium]|nr:prepilin-type N-terminal cleavage/methylation domain-containing protein [Nitrospirota bacterium]
MTQRGKERGFSLIEVVVMVAILALMAGIAIPLIGTSLRIKGKEATREEMGNIETAINMYYQDTTELPSTLADLNTDPGVSGWDGPYMTTQPNDDYTKDAWQKSYYYDPSYDTTGGSTPNSILLYSYGHNGQDDSNSGTSLDYNNDLIRVISYNMIRERKERVRDELDKVNAAAEEYDNVPGNSYPTQISDLVPAYIGVTYQSDEWGNNYVKKTGANQFISIGPDGTQDTADDIGPH